VAPGVAAIHDTDAWAFLRPLHYFVRTLT
jgi:hypothetical protein